jgi:hypothetical protein
MMPKVPTMADLKKVAEDIEKKVQGAGAAIRERWNLQVKPKLDELEKKANEQGQKAGEFLRQQASNLGNALDQFRNELAEDLKLGIKSKPEAKPEATKPADAPKTE